MPFKVAARTILQLGIELISSDGVAFYELIKNAFDAHSRKGVRIDVVVRIPHTQYRALRELLNTSQAKSADDLRPAVLKAIDRTTPNADKLVERVENADTRNDLLEALEEANFIKVRDTGEGMSRQQLETVYLTIGTRSRLNQRENSSGDGRPILGDKGIGRLSTMRLGMRLRVTTTKAGEKRWNLLNIDWKDFSRPSEQLIGDLPVEVEDGPKKTDTEESGTTIHISDLNDEWSLAKLQAVSRQEFSRLMDPFSPPQMRMFFRFNEEPVPIPPINKLLFEHADAYVEAEIKEHKDLGFELRGEIIYHLRNRRKALHFTEDHLKSSAALNSRAELRSLGPFKMICYWFNRRRLQAIEGIGDVRAVKALVDEWGGGLMLFRDGFRVHPYGGPSDDWLQLDPIAFKSQGYKVNRKQLVGKVEISSRNNPLLVDQTNREGLRDNLQTRALISILQGVLKDLRLFANTVDEEIKQKELLDFDELERRVEGAQLTLNDTVEELVTKYPREKQLVSSIRSVAEDLKDIMFQAKELAEGLDKRQNQLVHLAGIGLMVEVVAHELNRATQYTLTLLSDSDLDEAPAQVQQTLETLESQLKTIQKRLRILDPISTAGRQVKERFDVVPWVREILSAHDAQFERHDISLRVRVVPANGEFRVRAVKGMIVQVFENLISNSVYWLKRAKLDSPNLKPEITVVMDCNEHEIRFSDNGPGVEVDRREDIFLPFVSTKPAREGKGLGLYVSREIAQYHGGKLYLSEKPSVHPRTLNTFVFEISPDDK
jgi:signal transduction histidine kinase